MALSLHVFYQTFEQHFDSYVRAYEDRFEPARGRCVAWCRRRVEHFLACGRLQGGFAPVRCPSCKSEHLVAFMPHSELLQQLSGQARRPVIGVNYIDCRIAPRKNLTI